MITSEHFPEHNLIVTRYHGHVTAQDLRATIPQFEALLAKVRPGFAIITDLTHLTEMDGDCAALIGEVMEALGERGLASVIRVIPEPGKDIGFELISRFHQHHRVHASTAETFAEALELSTPRAQE